MDIAERIRGLRFVRPVPFRIQSRDVITDFVRSKIDAEELERSRVFYVALGLLDPDLDIHELLVRVLGEQIVGYYDPDQGLMVLREDVAEHLESGGGHEQELGEAEMVIVHELVHALQDQRLGLGEQYDAERSIDADNAFASLVEGDATLAMIGHMAGGERGLRRITRNTDLLRMLIRSNPQSVQGQEIESAPPIVRIPLASRYLDGLVFCATLHGGGGWAGVDRAHAHPPTSTEQVLHPERYIANEQPIEIELPALPALTDAGWAPHEEDTLGELEMSIYFGLGRSGDRDERAAEGWGGDWLRVYRNDGGDTAVVWFTVWDDENEAREAEAAARAVAAQMPGDRVESQRVARTGPALLIIRNLPPAQHAAVLAEFGRFATGRAR